jgi:hypothetical protein
MMTRRWLTVPMTGTGTDRDPYRPDFGKDEAELDGWSLGATDGVDCLVLAVRRPSRGDLPSQVPDRAKQEHGDELEDALGSRSRVDKSVRDKLVAEAARLGAPKGWSLEAVDVNPGAV